MATPERTLDPAQEEQQEGVNGHAAEALSEEIDWETFRPERPNIDHLITEDDTPVDNWFSETQQRLLAESLYNSWQPGQPFITMTNVGLFHTPRLQAIVPDVLVSLGVEAPEDMREKYNRSYFTWEFGKPPDVVVEIVSNRKGNEISDKVERYANMGVPYYAICDPWQLIQAEFLVAYQKLGGMYVRKENTFFDSINLGLTLWEGVFEEKPNLWLRWVNGEGNLLLTGSESTKQEKARAEQEKARAEQEKARAEQEKARAEQEKARAERAEDRADQEKARANQAEDRAEQEKARVDQLIAKLHDLGVDPSEI